MAFRKAIITNAVTTIFNAIGDLKELCTYRLSTTTYDPTTGTNTVSTSDSDVNAVFTSYNKFQIDGVTIRTTDIKMIAQQVEFDSEPDIANGSIIREDGSVYTIIFVNQDPANATYSLQLRAP